MVWLMHSGSLEWVIRDSTEHFDDAEQYKLREFSDAGSALAFVHGIQEDGLNFEILRELAAERYHHTGITGGSERRLAALVASELESGRLQVYERFRPMWIGGRQGAPGESETDQGESQEQPPPPAEDEETTWIKFEVLDDETGQPVPGVTLVIKLPDGSIKKSKTDGSGMIEISGIQPGSCSIESMMDSDALEVVSIT